MCNCNTNSYAPVTFHNTTTAPCTGGEPCDTLVDDKCVVSTQDVPSLGITKNMRLDAIFRNFGLNQNTQSISTEDTNSVDLTGTGLNSDKLKANAKIDTDEDNILEVTTNGLLVKIDETVIAAILNKILSTPALMTLFCQVGAECDFGCGSTEQPTVTLS